MESNNPVLHEAPNNEEKTLSLLCHLSIFMGGVILPIIIWATQKDKSKFTRFHSLQSIWFHVAYVAMIIILIIVFALIFVVGMAGTGAFASKHGNPDENFGLAFGIGMAVFYIGLFGIIFGAIGYSIYMAVKTYQGNLVKYPIIGNMIYKKVYGTTTPQ